MAVICVVDDDWQLNDTVCAILAAQGHATKAFLRLADLEAYAEFTDLVFLDLTLPDGSGLHAIPRLQGLPGSPEIIVLTGSTSSDGAAIAMAHGVWDYITKPFDRNDLLLVIKRALEYRAMKTEKVAENIYRDGIIGSSTILHRALDQMVAAARSDASVLITGETGTGKELFARAVHANSRRRNGPFVVVDCAALPAGLAESVLFGHVKGAFTGADKASDGLVKAADNGTLFLDELGELPKALQAGFLRVLQEKKFRALGASQEDSSDFRLVCATNRNLEAMVTAGEFREDLLYRVKSFSLHLPSLRERREDIPEIASASLGTLAERYNLATKEMADDFLRALSTYDWPGNVRELVQTLEKAFGAAGEHPILYGIHLPSDIRTRLAQESMRRKSTSLSAHPVATEAILDYKAFRNAILEEAELHYFRDLLFRTNHNIAEVSRLSGLGKTRVYDLLKKHGLTHPDEAAE